MLDKDHQFKRSLLRMMQAGAFEEMLECQAGQPAAVEFRLERVYQVHLRCRTIVLKERDSETVRRKLNGQWQRLGPPMVQRDRVVLKRRLGISSPASSGRSAKGNRRSAPRREQPAVMGAA